jgi:hypothetical protein
MWVGGWNLHWRTAGLPSSHSRSRGRRSHRPSPEWRMEKSRICRIPGPRVSVFGPGFGLGKTVAQGCGGAWGRRVAAGQ